MEKNTEGLRTASKKQPINLQILENSRETAISLKELYPKAEIYPFDPVTLICHWSWKDKPGCKNIENYQPGKKILWGIKMSSVPLVILDFDIFDKVLHPEGMRIETFNTLKRDFGLSDYPYFTVGKSGQGGHYWFSDKDAPKHEINMDFIQGIDYKVNSIIFLTKNPFSLIGKDDLRTLPKEYLNKKKDLRSTKPRQGRFFTQQKKSFASAMNGNPKGIFEAYHEARSKGQSITQAFSVARPTLEKLDFIPTPEPPEPPKQKSTNTKGLRIEWVTAPKVQSPGKWLLPGFIPFGAYSVWAGPTGKGRTTTLLNLLTLNALGKKLPGTDQKGDKRPFLYHGPENALALIQKRVKDAGGDLSRDIHFLQMIDKKGQRLPEMQVPRGDLAKNFLSAIESGRFSAVVADTLYLLLKDQNKGSADVLLPIAQKCLQIKNTAFIGVAHLKKNIADQEVVQHVKGDSDIVTLARSVIYLREGKEKTQRVIVPLKNSLTGDLDTGFVTTMPDDDSALSFQHYSDNNFAILKEHAKPFSSFTDAPTNKAENTLIKEIQQKYAVQGTKTWPTKDFRDFVKARKKGCSQPTMSRLMRKAGFKSEKIKDTWVVVPLLPE